MIVWFFRKIWRAWKRRATMVALVLTTVMAYLNTWWMIEARKTGKAALQRVSDGYDRERDALTTERDALWNSRNRHSRNGTRRRIN